MKSKKTQENEQQERSYLELQSFELKRVKEARGGVVFFDAVINGITIYGMKIVPKKDQSGDFVAWPSTKGTDGEYHSTAFAFLRPETEQSIMAAVQEKLDE